MNDSSWLMIHDYPTTHYPPPTTHPPPTHHPPPNNPLTTYYLPPATRHPPLADHPPTHSPTIHHHHRLQLEATGHYLIGKTVTYADLALFLHLWELLEEVRCSQTSFTAYDITWLLWEHHLTMMGTSLAFMEAARGVHHRLSTH